MESPFTTQTVVGWLDRLTDPVRLARVWSTRAANARLNRCMFWLHEAERLGESPGDLLEQALVRQVDTAEHRALVKRALLKNYRRLRNYGALIPENLTALRKGASPVAMGALHAGETLEVDHVIAVNLVPELAKDFANLAYLPRKRNRTKQDRVTNATLTLLRKFERWQMVSSLVVTEAGTLYESGLTVRSGRKLGLVSVPANGGTVALAGGGAFSIDPRRVVSRMERIVESIHEWEPRADSAMRVAQFTQVLTAEHVVRSQRMLVQAREKLGEDQAVFERMEGDFNHWDGRIQTVAMHANEALAQASAVHRRAQASVAHWKGQIEIAQAWLRRAQVRERAARREVDLAEQAERSAQYALDRAESELASAQSRTRYAGKDRDGNSIYEPIDTSAYERAVDAAEAELRRCQARLAEAEYELDQAVVDREAAEARMEACERALQLSDLAVESTLEALSSAQDAGAAVERGREEFQRANLLLVGMRKVISGHREAVGAMEGHGIAAAAEQAVALAACLRAHEHHATARRKSTQGRLEMEWRSAQLRAFDAPVMEI